MVESLTMSDLAVTNIEENAFNSWQFEHLISLKLAKMRIQRISKDIFNGLKNLELLYVQHTDIEQFDENAFYHLQLTLVTFFIRDCPQRLQINNMFKSVIMWNLDKLCVVSCEINDSINALTFAGVKNAIEIWITNTSIAQIEIGAFDISTRTLQMIDISYNKLTTLPVDLFRMVRLETLEVNQIGNPWHCDYMLDKFLDYVHKLPNVEFDDFICESPWYLRGKNLSSLKTQFISSPPASSSFSFVNEIPTINDTEAKPSLQPNATSHNTINENENKVEDKVEHVVEKVEDKADVKDETKNESTMVKSPIEIHSEPEIDAVTNVKGDVAKDITQNIQGMDSNFIEKEITGAREIPSPHIHSIRVPNILQEIIEEEEEDEATNNEVREDIKNEAPKDVERYVLTDYQIEVDAKTTNDRLEEGSNESSKESTEEISKVSSKKSLKESSMENAMETADIRDVEVQQVDEPVRHENLTAEIEAERSIKITSKTEENIAVNSKNEYITEVNERIEITTKTPFINSVTNSSTNAALTNTVGDVNSQTDNEKHPQKNSAIHWFFILKFHHLLLIFSCMFIILNSMSVKLL